MSPDSSLVTDELIELVYAELRGLARRYFQRERPGHTLQATALVHEAYLALMQRGTVPWEDRAQFTRIAAQAMRRILVNHARDRGRMKRGGHLEMRPLDEAEELPSPTTDILALDAALSKLEHVDRRKVEIVQLRYFAGLSLNEVADNIGISISQIKRDWTFARAWLYREMTEEEE